MPVCIYFNLIQRSDHKQIWDLSEKEIWKNPKNRKHWQINSKGTQSSMEQQWGPSAGVKTAGVASGEAGPAAPSGVGR